METVTEVAPVKINVLHEELKSRIAELSDRLIKAVKTEDSEGIAEWKAILENVADSINEVVNKHDRTVDTLKELQFFSAEFTESLTRIRGKRGRKPGGNDSE